LCRRSVRNRWEASVLPIQWFSYLRKASVSAILLIPMCSGLAQSNSTAPVEGQADLNTVVRDLQQQVKELRQAVAEIRSEADSYRSETKQLRDELHVLQSQSASPGATVHTAAMHSESSDSQPQSSSSDSIEQRVTSLEEQSQLLEGKVNEQYQTKVESAS